MAKRYPLQRVPQTDGQRVPSAAPGLMHFLLGLPSAESKLNTKCTSATKGLVSAGTSDGHYGLLLRYAVCCRAGLESFVLCVLLDKYLYACP